MIDSTELCVDLQCHIRQILILFPCLCHSFVDLHVDGVYPKFHIANTLKESVEQIERKFVSHLDTGIDVVICIL
jgi:hypothetical protein